MHFFALLMVTGPVLSFTDAATIALVQKERIDHVLSFDHDFDGIVPRLEPGERR